MCWQCLFAKEKKKKMQFTSSDSSSQGSSSSSSSSSGSTQCFLKSYNNSQSGVKLTPCTGVNFFVVISSPKTSYFNPKSSYLAV